MLNGLIKEANDLLRAGDFDYAFCGGYAIELFLDKEIRKHGDNDPKQNSLFNPGACPAI